MTHLMLCFSGVLGSGGGRDSGEPVTSAQIRRSRSTLHPFTQRVPSVLLHALTTTEQVITLQSASMHMAQGESSSAGAVKAAQINGSSAEYELPW